MPPAAQTAAPLALLLGDGHRSLGVLGLEQPLRRRRLLFVEVDVLSETTAQQRPHRARGERIRHAPRLDRRNATAGKPPPSNSAVLPPGRATHLRPAERSDPGQTRTRR